MNNHETPLISAAPWPERLIGASRELLSSGLPTLRAHPHARALARAVLHRYPRHRTQLEHVGGLIGAHPLDLGAGHRKPLGELLGADRRVAVLTQP